MAISSNNLKQTLPQRRKPDSYSFDISERGVSAWIEDLPVGSLGSTSQKVHGTLCEVNSLILPWKRRFHFLEQLRPTIAYLQSSLKKKYVGMSFPLTERAAMVAKLSQSLDTEMALSYRITIAEMTGRRMALLNDKHTMALLIYRAIYYLSCSLINTCQTYNAYPPSQWQELHRLYLLAEGKELDSLAISDQETSPKISSSISLLYRQILLLALSSPYRLQQHEITDVYTALGEWSESCELLSCTDGAKRGSISTVHLDTDNPPCYNSFDFRSCHGSMDRAINTKALEQRLIESLETDNEGNIKGPRGTVFSTTLLQRLASAWGQSPSRQRERERRDEDIEVVVGISAIHQMLARERGIDSMLEYRSSFKGGSVIYANSVTTEDVWKLGIRYEATPDINCAPNEQKPPSLVEVAVHRWRVNNESEGGYALHTHSGDSKLVRVGALIGIRSSNSGGNWEIGEVRWFRGSEGASLEMGIKVISNQVLPILIKEWDTTDQVSALQPGLLLPPNDASELGSTLITPIRLFRMTDHLMLVTADSTLSINLEKIVNATVSFMQFSYTLNDDESYSREDDENRFKTLWSSL